MELSEAEIAVFTPVKRKNNELVKSIIDGKTKYRIKTTSEDGEVNYLGIACTENHLHVLKLLVNEYQKRGI